jgi:hypothetical protein
MKTRTPQYESNGIGVRIAAASVLFIQNTHTTTSVGSTSIRDYSEII